MLCLKENYSATVRCGNSKSNNQIPIQLIHMATSSVTKEKKHKSRHSQKELSRFWEHGIHPITGYKMVAESVLKNRRRADD